MNPKGRLEGEVQAGIIGYLNTRQDIFFWRQNTGGQKIGNRFVRFGIPGAPDIMCAQAPTGRMVGIECKREKGGSVSPDQKWWGEQLEDHGGKYIVARSVEDVMEGLGEQKACVAKDPRRKRVIAR